MTTQELCAALRAELSDFVDDLKEAGGRLFSDGGRSSLKRMQRMRQLIEAIEEREQDQA